MILQSATLRASAHPLGNAFQFVLIRYCIWERNTAHFARARVKLCCFENWRLIIKSVNLIMRPVLVCMQCDLISYWKHKLLSYSRYHNRLMSIFERILNWKSNLREGNFENIFVLAYMMRNVHLWVSIILLHCLPLISHRLDVVICYFNASSTHRCYNVPTGQQMMRNLFILLVLGAHFIITTWVNN